MRQALSLICFIFFLSLASRLLAQGVVVEIEGIKDEMKQNATFFNPQAI